MTGSEKEGSARRSFRLKVEIMERLAQLETADRGWFPRNVIQLVEWEDEMRGLTRWVSYSVAALNGRNADLRRRFDVALRNLENRVTKSTPGRSVGHAQALLEVKNLAEQNVLLVAEKQELRKRIALLEQSLERMYLRERGLIEKLNKILPAERQLQIVAPE